MNSKIFEIIQENNVASNSDIIFEVYTTLV